MTKENSTDKPELHVFTDNAQIHDDGTVTPIKNVLGPEDVCEQCSDQDWCIAEGYCSIVDENPDAFQHLISRRVEKPE